MESPPIYLRIECDGWPRWILAGTEVFASLVMNGHLTDAAVNRCALS